MFWLSCWCGKELNRPIRAKPLNLLYSLIALQNKVHTQTNQYRFVHHICVHTIWLKKAGLKFKCKTLKLVQSKCLQHNCLYKMFSFNIMIFGLSEVCAFSWINFTFGFGLWVWVKWLPFSKRLYKVEGFHDVTFLYLSLYQGTFWGMWLVNAIKYGYPAWALIVQNKGALRSPAGLSIVIHMRVCLCTSVQWLE